MLRINTYASAYMDEMSPCRRSSILYGTWTLFVRSNVFTNSRTDTPRPVPKLKV